MVFDGEGCSSVGFVESFLDLLPLVSGQVSGRDDGNTLLLVKQLIVFVVLLRDTGQVGDTLALDQVVDESHGSVVQPADGVEDGRQLLARVRAVLDKASYLRTLLELRLLLGGA